MYRCFLYTTFTINIVGKSDLKFKSYRSRRGKMLWLTDRLGLYVVLALNVPMTKIPDIGFLYFLP